ncbi:MAG: polymer-forming cytoskeletal protein [Pseudomonadota bacterium]
MSIQTRSQSTRKPLIKVPRAANDSAFVFSAGVRVEGLIVVRGDVDLWGLLDGEIRCRNIIVHGGATVFGTIVAETVDLYGKVRDGTIAADSIRIRTGCDVEADLYYAQLDIDEGGLFEGKTRRNESPQALFPPN